MTEQTETKPEAEAKIPSEAEPQDAMPAPETPADPEPPVVADASPVLPAPPVPVAEPEVQQGEQAQQGPLTLAGPPAPPVRKPSRRVLWAVARWTAAVLVCGGLGTGTAFGIASMERHEVPGLATESDGRWEYPKLSLPALPADAPRPTATATWARSTTPTCANCSSRPRSAPHPTRSSTAAGSPWTSTCPSTGRTTAPS